MAKFSGYLSFKIGCFSLEQYCCSKCEARSAASPWISFLHCTYFRSQRKFRSVSDMYTSLLPRWFTFHSILTCLQGFPVFVLRLLIIPSSPAPPRERPKTNSWLPSMPQGKCLLHLANQSITSKTPIVFRYNLQLRIKKNLNKGSFKKIHNTS